MVVFGFVAAVALLFRYEWVHLRRYGGGAKEMIVFVGLMVVAVGFSLAVMLHVPIPSPIPTFDKVLGPVANILVGTECSRKLG